MLDLTRTEPPLILVASPAGGVLKPAYMNSYLSLFGSLSPEEAKLERGQVSGSNIAENQNTLVDQAQDMGADYILLVETDMQFPGNALKQLLSHEKDIVGCAYAYKDHDLLAKIIRGDRVGYRLMGNELGGGPITIPSLVSGDALRKVEFIPMGLTLISLKAIDIVQAYRATQINGLPEGIKPCVFRHAEITLPEYKRTANSTTDSSFCRDARDAGLDVWLDARLSLRVLHHGDCAYGLLPAEPDANPVGTLQEEIAAGVNDQ